MNLVETEKDDFSMVEISSEEFYCQHCKTSFLSGKKVMEHICRNISPTFRNTFSKQNQFIHKDELNLIQYEFCNKSFSTLKSERHYKELHHHNIEDYKSATISTTAFEVKSSSHTKSINNSYSPDSGFLKKVAVQNVFVENNSEDLSLNNGNNQSTNEVTMNTFELGKKLPFGAVASNLKTFYCGYCSARFSSEKELLEHTCLKKGPSSENTFRCTLCTAKLKTRRTLQRHMLTHNTNLPLKCMYCPRTFAYRSRLNEHLQVHTSSKLKTLHCPHCPATLKSQETLRNHMLTHGEHKRFKCEYCTHSFHLQSDLKEHLKTHSPSNSEKGFHCPYCSAILETSRNLKFHLMRHKSEKTNKCEYCPRAFYTSTRLKMHLITHSTTSKTLRCPICPAILKYQRTLNRHMSIHNLDKPYKCEQCTSSFNRADGLRDHMEVHVGKRNYECTVCMKTFSSMYSLQRHKSRDHRSRNKINLPDFSTEVSKPTIADDYKDEDISENSDDLDSVESSSANEKQ